MTALHAAMASDKAREIVADVLAEFDAWADHAVDQAEAIALDKRGAARFALNDVRAELMDHLVIRIGATLASWGAP